MNVRVTSNSFSRLRNLSTLSDEIRLRFTFVFELDTTVA